PRGGDRRLPGRRSSRGPAPREGPAGLRSARPRPRAPRADRQGRRPPPRERPGGRGPRRRRRRGPPPGGGAAGRGGTPASGPRPARRRVDPRPGRGRGGRPRGRGLRGLRPGVRHALQAPARPSAGASRAGGRRPAGVAAGARHRRHHGGRGRGGAGGRRGGGGGHPGAPRRPRPRGGDEGVARRVPAGLGLRAGADVYGTVSASYPARVVCLSADTTEIAFAVGAGDRVVGVSGAAVRPPEARSRPKVGGFTTFRVDRIVALRPDLVLAFSDLQADVVRDLVRAGVPVLASNPRSLAQVFQAILVTGGALGREAAARALVADMQEEIRQVREFSSVWPDRPRVYFEEWD